MDNGVSFDEASQALECGQVVVLKEDSDSGEDHYVYLGFCKKLRVLVVVVAYPEERAALKKTRT